LLNLSDYRNLAEKKPVHEALAGKDFTASGINGIREAFINAVEKQKNVEQDRVLENQAINAINNATVDTMAQVLEDYNSVLKLDLLNEYGYKMLLNKKLAGTSNAIDYLYNAIIGQNTLDAIRDIFEQQVAIQAINCADWQEINEVINSNNAVLKLNLSGDYANLYYDDKIAVHKALAAYGNFTTIKEIQDVFNSKVSALKQETVKQSVGPRRTSGSSSVLINEETSEKLLPQQSIIFNDIADVPWAKESIQALANNGIIQGISPGIFAPNSNITREQFVKMLVMAFGLLDESAVSDFKDINQEEWYYKYISSAYKHGIINGIGHNVFGIGMEISRQDMAVLAYRAAKYVGINLPVLSPEVQFDDMSSIADYAKDSVTAMQQANIIQGVGDNRFAPYETATRAMAAKVIYELLKL